METFMTVVAGVRSTREELGLARDLVGKVLIIEAQPGAAEAIAGQKGAFRQLSGCDLTEVISGGSAPAGRYASVIAPGVKALLDLEGLFDVDRERERLLGKARKAEAEMAKARAKLGNQGFVAKAPEAVVAEERSRLLTAEAVLVEVRLQYEERIGGALPGRGGGKQTLSNRQPAILRTSGEYVNGLERLGIRLGLERVTKLVEALDSPHKAYRTIHVVGTNGKSSTTRFISALLEAQGLKVGAYVSPHLISLAERQMINSVASTEDEFCDLVARIRPVVDEARQVVPAGGGTHPVRGAHRRGPPLLQGAGL